MSLVSVNRAIVEVLGPIRDDFQLLSVEQQDVLFQVTVIALVSKLLSKSKIHMNQVDNILLSGDPSRATEAQSVLESFFSKKARAPVGFTSDQAVTYGAALQGNVINGEGEYYGDGCQGLTMDVNRLDLGFENSTGDFIHVIPRNTLIPIRKSVKVSTAEDYQEAVTIRVLERAREKTFGNKELGILRLVDLPRLPKGVLEIVISFELDTNDKLEVSTRYEGGPEAENLSFGERKYTEEEIESLLNLTAVPAES
ncbi:uncharacterized protein RSE6_10932 [Rhynchosporium secalis]|uniref:Uncharacterized protein n=1 Tax=Rhynchosporium secalis TaxID=38038 RepID=A0A1E1MLP6_RHYSE|nr:uncharacterized protein RSE6_10932 [Rhynchosporium secalis]